MPSLFQVKNAESAARLLQGRDAAALRRLRELNPHLGELHAASELPPGTVLLLPEGAGFGIAGEDGVGAAGWAQLASDATAGLKLRTEGVKAAMTARETQRQEVLKVIGEPDVARQLDADADLRKQADAATARFKAEQKSDAASARQFDTLGPALADELERLAALLMPRS